MQIRSRPPPRRRLALVVRGGSDRSPRRAGTTRCAVEARLGRQRFEGGRQRRRHFTLRTGPRRLFLLVVGTPARRFPAIPREARVTAAARLLSPGRSTRSSTVSPLHDADAAARIALGAALRSWRHDRYRTRLKDKEKPTLEEVTIVGAAADAQARWEQRWQPVLEGVKLTRELVTEPANIIYPETFVERCRHLADLGLELEVLDGAAMKSSLGACRLAQGSVRDRAC